MNRSPLNAAPIGTGTSVPFISAAAAATLALVVSLGVSIKKYMASASSLTLQGDLTFHPRVSGVVDSALRLGGSVLASVWREVYGAVNAFVAIAGAVTGVRRVLGVSSADIALLPSVNPTILHIVYVAVHGEMVLLGTCGGEDYYTGAAPDGRVFFVSQGPQTFYMTRD